MQVSELFQNDMFPDFKLLGGSGGLTNPIWQVSIIDTPDFCNWIRGGDFVVGNGYVFHENPERFPRFFRELAEKNVAALGMKFDRYRFANDYDMIIDLSNNLNIPLIEVPFKYTWNVIYEAIYRRTKEEAPTHGIFGDVLDLIDEGISPLNLIYMLSSKTNRIVIANAPKLNLKHLVEANSYAKYNYDYSDFEKTKAVEVSYLHNIGGISISTVSKKSRDSIEKYSCYKIASIEIYVRLDKKEENLPFKHENPTIKTLLLLYLMVMEDVIIQSEERNKINNIMEKLFSGRHADPQLLSNEIKKLGFFMPLPCRILYFYKMEAGNLHRIVSSLSPLNCSFGSEMAAIVGNLEFEKRLEEVRAIAEKEQFFVTYGNPAVDFSDIPSAFFQAKETMKWLKEIGRKEGVYAYEQILLNLAMKRFLVLDEAHLLASRYWEPLLKKSSKNAVPLAAFTEELIRNNYNLRATASVLSIHYNTGRNYLEEVEEILKIKLDNPDHRLMLMLAHHVAMEKGQ